MKKTALIYVLRDPTTNEVRYVGKTVQGLKKRLDAHLRNSKQKKTHRDCWIAGLVARGQKPLIEQVESVEGDWASRERHWIAYYRQAGNLTNQTGGGEGVDPEVISRSWTPERRARMSQWSAEMNRARAGTKWSERRKAQQAASQLTRWSRPGEREAQSARMSQLCADPEYRAKQSASVAASWSDERRAAQSEVARRVNQKRWSKGLE